MRLLTVGHGPLDRSALGPLLTGAGITRVVDIRRFPGSRSNADVARDALAAWLPEAGIEYAWEPRLGGRRHLRTAEDEVSPDVWWQVKAFRAYAAHTRTAEFREGLDAVLGDLRAGRQAAVMCSESVWWRCHRRLVADVAVLGRGIDVGHLMPDGKVREHVPSAGARRTADGNLVWDVS